jgi:hypothetical protein
MSQAALKTHTAGLAEEIAPRITDIIREQIDTALARRGEDDDPIHTTREAAARLRKAVSTLELWRSAGIGPEWVRIGPRSIGYRTSALNRFAAVGGKTVAGK